MVPIVENSGTKAGTELPPMAARAIQANAIHMKYRTFLSSSLLAGLAVFLHDAASSAPTHATSHLKHAMDGMAVSMVDMMAHAEHRSFDGWGNNETHPDWGSAGSMLVRMSRVDYQDGASMPSGMDRPNPRDISNAVVAQDGMMPNPEGVSDLFWQWGQFLDHDITLTPVIFPFERLDIPVPAGDPFFDPFGTGRQVIAFERSFYVMHEGVREQVNFLTAFIDASNVYGSDEARARELRTLDGTGRMKTSAGNLLPFNQNGFSNLPVDGDPNFFLAGDVRANEQNGLTAMHTLFVREHNHWADLIRKMMPGADGDSVFHMARAMVGAEMQCVTYREFLPLLLGPDAIPPYAGYRPDVNPGIATEFSSASYRLGHTLLAPVLMRMKKNLSPIPEGDLPLRDAFFNPAEFIGAGGPEPLLRGLANHRAQTIDGMIVDDVRNFLFGPPGAGGFDLAALNIQRGRDHGLPGYNQVRRDIGLAPRASFTEVTSDRSMQGRLASVYPSVEDVDLWVGGLAEDHAPGALVGETILTIVRDQFVRLRDGDRYWYQNHLPKELASMVEAQKLSDIIRRNTGIQWEIQDNALMVPDGR